MFLERKNNLASLASEEDWHPDATLEVLKSRAALLENIRQFFKVRNVLEVETPLLCHAAIQDPHLHPIPAQYSAFGDKTSTTLYLQTSPEFAMKRLLAAYHHIAIYQICKAFRNGEVGKLHNPEFTMLEWYRPGFDHFQLMDEMDQFLFSIIQAKKSERLTYQTLFLKYLNIDPFLATIETLQDVAIQSGLDMASLIHVTRDDWLNLLLTHCIEPHLGFSCPTFVYDFPASQAALARISSGHLTIGSQSFDIAERFEVYIQGMEIANGYHELTDWEHQETRFLEDAKTREHLQHPPIPIDNHLINALKSGMPASAGVALGVDRLLMIKMNMQSVQETLAFPINKA